MLDSLLLLLCIVIGMLFFGDTAGRSHKEEAVRMLTLELQEGFRSEHVRILVDGEEVIDKTDVSTKLLLGYAEQIAVEVEHDITRVEVELPRRHLRESIELDIETELWLGISLEEEKIVFTERDSPFTYL